jgi:hypothetical protein
VAELLFERHRGCFHNFSGGCVLFRSLSLSLSLCYRKSRPMYNLELALGDTGSKVVEKGDIGSETHGRKW